MVEEASRAAGGVQSLERAFGLLEELADAGGEASLSELAARCGLPPPTIHRLVRTLVAHGYVRQQPSRRYALGPRLIRLGDSAGRLLGSWARPLLARLVEVTGETANMAVLDGPAAVYVAQVPSKHAMRMFTEVGRRVGLHCTAVGKALAAGLPTAEARRLVAEAGMARQTPATVTDEASLLAELEAIRSSGYATDDGEQEIGVRCVAVPLLGAPTRAALSVSGPEGRLSTPVREQIVPVLQRTAAELVTLITSTDVPA